MAHIWSDDVDTGVTYNGTWDLQGTLQGQRHLVHHFIDETDVPWVYPGVETFILLDAALGASPADEVSVSLPTLDGDPTDAAVLAALDLACNTALGVFGSIKTVTWSIGPTGDFNMTTAGGDTFLGIDFANPLVTSWQVFDEAQAIKAAATVQVLSTRYADPRPHALELNIDQVSTKPTFSRVTGAAITVPMSDTSAVPSRLLFQPCTELDMWWARLNAPAVVVPMTNIWHLIFD